MLQRIPFPVMSGGFTPSLVWILGSVVLFGATVRGDSSSRSQAVTTGTPGARSLENSLSTVGAFDLGTFGGSGTSTIVDFAGLRESIGTPALTEAAHPTFAFPSNGLAPITDFPVVDGRNVEDGQPLTHTPDTTFPIAGLVRSLVIGTFGFFVIRRMRQQEKR